MLIESNIILGGEPLGKIINRECIFAKYGKCTKPSCNFNHLVLPLTKEEHGRRRYFKSRSICISFYYYGHCGHLIGPPDRKCNLLKSYYEKTHVQKIDIKERTYCTSCPVSEKSEEKNKFDNLVIEVNDLKVKLNQCLERLQIAELDTEREHVIVQKSASQLSVTENASVSSPQAQPPGLELLREHLYKFKADSLKEKVNNKHNLCGGCVLEYPVEAYDLISEYICLYRVCNEDENRRSWEIIERLHREYVRCTDPHQLELCQCDENKDPDYNLLDDYDDFPTF